VFLPQNISYSFYLLLILGDFCLAKILLTYSNLKLQKLEIFWSLRCGFRQIYLRAIQTIALLWQLLLLFSPNLIKKFQTLSNTAVEKLNRGPLAPLTRRLKANGSCVPEVRLNLQGLETRFALSTPGFFALSNHLSPRGITYPSSSTQND